ncbi:hypothetical protein AXF42_Ash005435 [Apostasia shenzhenica]|uniref:Uncharacterized protein n=1 Tax=Apostasia shenzhenica TaxID=1088818 RepID=A0A2I0B6Y4_9ASPA|nr:hypothetical protein AXF42_Ash005435 [Apostasia shenzhenica]
MVVREVEEDASIRRQQLAGVNIGEKSIPCFPSKRESKFFLHNFSFPTPGWGCQRILRCINAVAENETGGGNRSNSSSSNSSPENPLEISPAPAAKEKLVEQAHASAAPVRKWNLRKRRAACLDLIRSDGGGMDQRPKFSISLSRKEIEEDFIAFTGKKPPRRPQRRPRNVQRQLDKLFPGSLLSDVTLTSYKVNK